MTTLAFVLAAIAELSTGQHDVLAGAIARNVDAEPALFRGDPEKHQTAALFVAIAYRETGGTFALDAVGDHGHSFCAFQVNDGAGGTRAMLADADLCVRGARRVLEWSIRACPKHPIALYAAGARGCTMPVAQRISADRMAIAKRLVARAAEAAKSSLFCPTSEHPLLAERPRGPRPEAVRHEASC